jgi:hypothetical protein
VDREEHRRRVAQRPNAVSLSELQSLLEEYGWSLKRVHGSHYIFSNRAQTISAPFKRPHVLPVYVRRVLRLLEEQDEAASAEEVDGNS